MKNTYVVVSDNEVRVEPYQDLKFILNNFKWGRIYVLEAGELVEMTIDMIHQQLEEEETPRLEIIKHTNEKPDELVENEIDEMLEKQSDLEELAKDNFYDK